MFPKADMLGVFSELVTADKEQTVANPIIIKSKLDNPLSKILQFSLLMWNMEEFAAKPVKDNLAILSGNL